MAINRTGSLVISLDFELLWGVFDVVNFKEKSEYFQNTLNVIPEILNAFNNYKIKATWATVGMLFNENWEEWEENIPGHLPNYENSELSAYNFGRKNKSTFTEKMCFAPKLINQISHYTGQEIGTHTYSHYYCLERGQDKASFLDDLKQTKLLAKKFDISVISLVFPRNQLNLDYLDICHTSGITNVRSNPSSWYWKKTNSNSVFTKIARTGDAYFPLGNKNYNIIDIEQKNNLPLEQKASRFLRPVENNSILRKAKLKRICTEMNKAAKNGEIYHLWWHPHNFGDHPQQSMEDLQTILKYYRILQNKYGFKSENMGSLGKHYLNEI